MIRISSATEDPAVDLFDAGFTVDQGNIVVFGKGLYTEFQQVVQTTKTAGRLRLAQNQEADTICLDHQFIADHFGHMLVPDPPFFIRIFDHDSPHLPHGHLRFNPQGVSQAYWGIGIHGQDSIAAWENSLAMMAVRVVLPVPPLPATAITFFWPSFLDTPMVSPLAPSFFLPFKTFPGKKGRTEGTDALGIHLGHFIQLNPQDLLKTVDDSGILGHAAGHGHLFF